MNSFLLEPRPLRASGFTLVEMAMVLLIVALLLSGLVPTITNQMEQQRSNEARKQLDEIQQALLGFAVINGRLPCPAILSSSGVESPSGGGNCTNFYNGYVPAATLGITTVNNQGLAIDPWGNPIRYAVTAWSKTTTPTVNNVYTTTNGMSSVGISNLNPNLMVCSTATGISSSACGSANDKLTAGDGVPVVLYSTGKNGSTGGTGTDEAANPNVNSSNNDRVFVSHTPTPSTASNGEFDDIVIWVSNPLLLNRMISAGKLP
ncbi:MAG: prepilin-type N-terminal cleavage/methylation domain-containing protein [Pseudomonadota bacterium]